MSNFDLSPPELTDPSWLNALDQQRIAAVYNSHSACFSDLVKAARLNPLVDLRFSNLTAVDFAGSDLRGYNFAGANLSYTKWLGAIWDSTTVLAGAVLTGASGLTDVNPTKAAPLFEGSGNLQNRSKTKFQHLFDYTPMAIVAVDSVGVILSANERFQRLAENLEYFPIVSNSILSLVRAPDRGVLRSAIQSASRIGAETPPMEMMLESAKERWGQFFVTAVADEGHMESVIVYILETTERRASEKRLYQAQMMDAVGQLAGGIAHDFNNVLSAIMMANDLLLNGHKPTDPSFQDLMQIKQGTTRAATLVRQLLAFSGRQPVRPQVLDLGDALSDLTMLLRRLIGESVKLDVIYGRDLWPVKVDISQFEQVIVNLVVNARDAMPDGGKLKVQTTNLPADEVVQAGYKSAPIIDYVLIDVSDTGAGIPIEILDKIFDPFFSTKEAGKGTGLGLATVYGIIKQAGGLLDVRSEVGKGTSFHILLPRHVREPASIVESAIVACAANELQSRDAFKARADLIGQGTILVVEDEEGLRSLNARGLRSRGYTVIEASDGVEALKEFDAHGGAVDLIVANVVMPRMDGAALLKAIRERNSELKFIFVSGYGDDTFDQKLPPGEQLSFLAKPYSFSSLIEKVRQTIVRFDER